MFETTKINEKRPGMAHLKMFYSISTLFLSNLFSLSPLIRNSLTHYIFAPKVALLKGRQTLTDMLVKCSESENTNLGTS